MLDSESQATAKLLALSGRYRVRPSRSGRVIGNVQRQNLRLSATFGWEVALSN